MARVALITAGGSGMGAASARALAEAGYDVGVLSSSGKGEALGRELGGIGVTGRMESAADIRKLVAAAMDRWGRIDVLVNSAGHGPKGALADLTEAQWWDGLETYLMGAIRASSLVAPIMVGQRRGVILNISSFSAVEPSAAFPTSSVARAGLAAYAKLFSDEYAPQGVRMNNVLPGFIDSLPEKETWREKIPMGRYGRVSEIAATVVFLASEGGAYITGQNIRVDGGITRSP